MYLFDPLGPVTMYELIILAGLTYMLLFLLGDSIFQLFRCLSEELSQYGPIVAYSIRVTYGLAILFLISQLFSYLNLLMQGFIICIGISGLVLVFRVFNLFIKKRYTIKWKVRGTLAFPCIVLTTLALMFFIGMSSIVGAYGSTNNDAAFHTLNISVFIRQNKILGQPLPFAEYYVTHGPVSFILGAFIHIITGYPLQRLVISLTSLMPPLIAISIYASSKILFKSEILSMTSTILTMFVHQIWDPIGWGGLPLLLGFVVTVSGFGIIGFLIRKTTNKYDLLRNAIFLSLILGLSVVTYPISIFYLVLWLMILFVIYLIWFVLKRDFLGVKHLFILISIVVVLTTLYSFSYIMRIFELTKVPPDYGVPIDRIKTGYDTMVRSWVLSIYNFPPYDILSMSKWGNLFGPVLFIAPYSSFIIIIYILNKKFNEIFLRMLACVILLFFIPFYFQTIEPFFTLREGHQGWYLPTERVHRASFIPLVLLSSVYVEFLLNLLKYISTLVSFSPRIVQIRISISTKKIVTTALVLFILACTSLSLGQIRDGFMPDLTKEIDNITSQLRLFSSIQESDISLMYWMRDNLPQNSVVFVDYRDAGQYVTPLTQLKSIYEPGPRQDSQAYRQVLSLLSSNPCDEKILSWLEKNNVTHIFLGSKTIIKTDEIFKINSTNLYFCPHFKLLKQINQSFLFSVVYAKKGYSE
jgi:hypothetical protein